MSFNVRLGKFGPTIKEGLSFLFDVKDRTPFFVRSPGLTEEAQVVFLAFASTFVLS